MNRIISCLPITKNFLIDSCIMGVLWRLGFCDYVVVFKFHCESTSSWRFIMNRKFSFFFSNY